MNISWMRSNHSSGDFVNVDFVHDDLVDDDRIWESLEAAQLADYVADLPFGLLTQIGDKDKD